MHVAHRVSSFSWRAYLARLVPGGGSDRDVRLAAASMAVAVLAGVAVATLLG